MKKLLFLLPLVLLLSCSIQKRKYQNGYYVEWNHKKTEQSKTVATKQKANKEVQATETSEQIKIKSGYKPDATAEVQPSFSEVLKKKFSFHKTGEDSCDVLIFKDGSEIRSKVEEVGIDEIKYKRCESPNGPMYVAKKSDLFMIKYTNGTKELIKSTESTASSNSAQPIKPYQSNSYRKETHPLAKTSIFVSGASALIAWFLLLYTVSESLDSGTMLFVVFFTALIGGIMGTVAINRINEQPDIYKGKGSAITALILGAILAFIFSIILMAYYTW